MAPLAPRQVTKHGKTKWLADLRAFGGGRLYRDTEAEALRLIADAIKGQEEYGKLATAMPLAKRIEYVTMEAQLASRGVTLKEVVDFWDKTHRPAAQKAISEAATECLDAKHKAGRRPRYLEQFGYSLDSLTASVGVDVLCSEVDHAAIEKWLNNPKWSAVSRNTKLIDARTFFSFCIKRGWCVSDPCTAVEPFTLDGKPPGILTVAQSRRIMEACRSKRPALLPFVVLGLFAGIRPQEIKRISWDNVNLESGYVEIGSSSSKTRRRRLAKLQPNAIQWLKLGGSLPAKNHRRMWDDVRKAAGFGLSKEAKKGEPWPHDALRHSFCSYSLPVHGAAQTALWAGHSESMLFSHYRELVTRESAEAFWAITPGDKI